jgi:hypothetical protein
MKPRVVLITALAILAGGPDPVLGAGQVGIVQPLTTKEFLQAPEDLQVIYVGGLIEGMSFAAYGSSIPDYAAWVDCVRRKTLGETTKDVIAFIRADPNFSEGVGSALAQTIGRRCKH